MNVWDALTGGIGWSHDGALYCWDGNGYRRTLWDDVTRDAERMTRGMRDAGVEPGTRVASILTNTDGTIRGLLGTWLAGGAIASLPVPARGMRPEEYAEQITSLCEHVNPVVFMVDEAFLPLIPEDVKGKVEVRSWESMLDSGTVDPSPPGDDELAFIQYSSGSTSVPKGCMLSTRAIGAQLEIISEMVEISPTDRGVTWLPLSHDMGMFGTLLMPWIYRLDSYVSPPERFAMAPRTWFAEIAEFGGTIAAGTNTALHLAARAHQKRPIEGSLAQLKTCIIGAERVQWDTLTYAIDALGSNGMRPEAIMPAYGLAEATLAVTSVRNDQRPVYTTVDAIALADGRIEEADAEDPSATKIVSGGTPCPGVELPGLNDSELGEIRVRSRSLADGYYGEPELTAERFVDGEVRPGDLGFVRDGHLYPVGRTDDVIILGGRNVYAREVEASIDRLEGVRTGCSTIVDRGDSARGGMTLLVEARDADIDFRALAEEAASVAMAKAAVPLDACVVLEKGGLPKTPTGKIQRHRCRQLLEADALEPLTVVELAAV